MPNAMNLVQQSFLFFRKHWFQLAWLSLPVIVAVTLGAIFLDHWVETIAEPSLLLKASPFLVELFGYPLYVVPMILFTHFVHTENVGYGTVFYWKQALSLWTSMLIVASITNLLNKLKCKLYLASTWSQL